MSPWWKTFFEGNFSDFFLERDKKTTKAIIGFLVKKLSLKKGMIVFDQCCGIGSLSLALARKGITTIGVDQSAAYITHAKKEAKRYGLNCTFHSGDAFAFIPPKRCDAVINWYTSFGYSRNDRKNMKMLACAYKSLKSGGCIILDYYNISYIVKHFEPLHREERNVRGKNFLITRFSEIDKKNGMLISTWTYCRPNGMEKVYIGETRMYTPSDFKKLFLKAGFTEIRLYGDTSGGALQKESPRCIIIGKKS